MADTERGDFPDDIVCTDCGEGNVKFKHWGLLVPPGEVGYFCGPCMKNRDKYLHEHGVPKPFPELTPAA